MSIVWLTDTQINIREFKMTDFQELHSYVSQLRVVQYMAWGPNTEEDTLCFIEAAIEDQKKEDRTRYELVVEDALTNGFIGTVGIYIKSASNRRGEVGYNINPKYWGLGYATKATKLILSFGFNTLQLHRIEATCDVRNIGSKRVLEKSGFKLEGHIRDHILLRDGWRDSYLFGVLEQEHAYKKE